MKLSRDERNQLRKLERFYRRGLLSESDYLRARNLLGKRPDKREDSRLKRRSSRAEIMALFDDDKQQEKTSTGWNSLELPEFYWMLRYYWRKFRRKYSRSCAIAAAFLSTFASLSVAVLVTLHIAGSKPIEDLVANLETHDATAASPRVKQDLTPLYFQPLFGPLAVENCLSGCMIEDPDSSQACQSRCARLSLARYPSYVPYPEEAPAQDALKALKQCLSASHASSHEIAQQTWQLVQEEALQVLASAHANQRHYQFGNARLTYRHAEQLLARIGLPPQAKQEDQQSAQRLYRALCLRAHLTLSELGLMLARQGKDSISERYYKDFDKALRPRVLGAEARILPPSVRD